MKNAFTLILFLYLAISCHDSKKNQLSNLVKEWSGKEIQFPSHLTFTVQGKDTVNFDYLHSTYKIIMYADSMVALVVNYSFLNGRLLGKKWILCEIKIKLFHSYFVFSRKTDRCYKMFYVMSILFILFV